MKIIKTGVLPAPKPDRWVGECKNCRCRIECDQDDVKALTATSKSPSFVCPCPTVACGHDINLNRLDLRGA